MCVCGVCVCESACSTLGTRRVGLIVVEVVGVMWGSCGVINLAALDS